MALAVTASHDHGTVTGNGFSDDRLTAGEIQLLTFDEHIAEHIFYCDHSFPYAATLVSSRNVRPPAKNSYNALGSSEMTEQAAQHMYSILPTGHLQPRGRA